VRLGNIDTLDLNLFDFDFDLTFAVFFLSADDRVYARYGQRDGRGPDALQSLKGLEHAMKSALQMHERDREAREFAPRDQKQRLSIREAGGRARRCYHCHNVREVFNRRFREAGKWERELAYHYPPTENIGLTLEVDRGNVIAKVLASSPADSAGLKKGDVLRRLDVVPIHSIADALYALERAPASGKVKATWTREGKSMSADLALAGGWRKSDLSWRPSMLSMVPSLPIRGDDLTAAEKKDLGLPPNQLAVRQRTTIRAQAQAAWVRAGDVLVGIDRELTDLDADRLHKYVRREYLVGDQVQLIVIREGKRLKLPLTLTR
jgi:predicted metalloprotease with PDZ domain